VKGSRGFTLIEVLAVVLLTGIVMGVALNFYLDLSRASNRAAGVTRESRRTAAVLDRLVRDFENTVYVHRQESEDPLAHPWIFLAESRSSELGADRVKFMTRSHDPGRSGAPESDLAVVTYALRRGPEGGLELWRSETPGLPDRLDRGFSPPGAKGDTLLADGVGAFGLLFLGDQPEPKNSWDSSSLVDGSELPQVVEIQLAMVEPGKQVPLEELTVQRRRVRLPVRPLDLQAMFEADEEAEQDTGPKTVCDCIDCKALGATPSGARLVEAVGSKPAAQGLRLLPAAMRQEVDPSCLL
jgi:prepilin-type N-terminal cleavage/methylation domain-containing protein